jgi:hypothetical protein
MSLAENVDPLAVRTTAADLISDQPSAGDGAFHYHQVAELHRYVNETVTYVPDPTTTNYVAPPEETLETEAGDCDCQATLVASLFEAIGATTRIVRCQSTNGDWHALAEVYLADSEHVASSEVCSSLGRYYSSHGSSHGEFSWDYDDGKFWFLADTAMGNYIGDRRSLANNGYIHNAMDGTWEWHNAEFHYPNGRTAASEPDYELLSEWVLEIDSLYRHRGKQFFADKVAEVIPHGFDITEVRWETVDVDDFNTDDGLVVVFDTAGTTEGVTNRDFERISGVKNAGLRM